HHATTCHTPPATMAKQRRKRPGRRPGRGHRRKSEPPAKRKFEKMAQREAQDARVSYESAALNFQKLEDFARKQRPDLRKQLLDLWDHMNRTQRQSVPSERHPEALGI